MTIHDAVDVPKVWPADTASRVPAWIYSDRGLFEREMERFHHGATWNYVGLECELPSPNSYRRAFVGTRPVVITRDADGVIHVVENRCAHRGSPVCWKQRGEATDLTCPYHQWSFDLAGNLLGIPFFRGAPRPNPGMPRDFDKAQNGLRKLKVHVENGVIFASFDHETPAFDSYVGPEIKRLFVRAFPGRELRLLGYSRQMLPCNWKLYWENSRDSYHATLLHSFFTTFGIYRADAKFAISPQEGGKHSVTASFFDANARNVSNDETKEMKTMLHDFRLEDMEVVSPVDEFGDGVICSYQLFPSMMMQQHGNILAIRHILPKSVTETELAWTFYGYADDDSDMQERRMKQGNLVGPAGYVSLDDSEVLEQMQRIANACPDAVQVVEMGGRDNIGPSETAVTETLIRAFYTFYRREMGL